jgi:hypothetical protein
MPQVMLWILEHRQKTSKWRMNRRYHRQRLETLQNSFSNLSRFTSKLVDEHVIVKQQLNKIKVQNITEKFKCQALAHEKAQMQKKLDGFRKLMKEISR